MNNGAWLSINDYSAYRKISISTIRRYIKRNCVKSKMEKGKYYIFVSNDNLKNEGEENLELSNVSLKLENEILKNQILKISEEKNELQMLMNLYEKRIADIPPEVPSQI